MELGSIFMINPEMAIYALKTGVNPNIYTGSVWIQEMLTFWLQVSLKSQSPIPFECRNDRYQNAPYSQWNSIKLGCFEMWRKLQSHKENLNRSKRFMRNSGFDSVFCKDYLKVQKAYIFSFLIFSQN